MEENCFGFTGDRSSKEGNGLNDCFDEILKLWCWVKGCWGCVGSHMVGSVGIHVWITACDRLG